MENPKIRFRMDNGLDYPHWGSKSFEEVFSPLNNNTFSRDMLNYEEGTAKSIHYGDILTTYGAICDVSSDVIPFVNEDIAYEKYDYLQNGDVILADTAEDETVGKAIELYGIKGETVISGLHTMACRPKQKYAPKYLGYLLNSPAFHNQLFPYMQGIMVTSIGRKNIASVKISYPCPAEQERIADFLSSVDEVITQTEAEVVNLEQQKKAAMKKVFSQEVHFKSDNETIFPIWNKRKMKDVATFHNGDRSNRYPKDNDIVSEGIAFLNTENIHNTIIDLKVKSKYITREKYEELSGAKLQLFDIAYCLRGSVGLCALNYYLKEGTIASSLMLIRAKQGEINPIYLFYTLNSLNVIKQTEKCLNGSCAGNLSAQEVSQFEIPYPCLEEQQKIADFLSAFDEAIDYAKQELEKWKELKKGLLQQMFV